MKKEMRILRCELMFLAEEPTSQKVEYPPFVDQVHGLSLALLSKSRKLRIFWFLVFFICTSCGMVTTTLVVIEYIKVPTATSITIKLVPSLELPAITICPVMPDALNYEPLFNNIQSRLPGITHESVIDLIRFWIGGSGLRDIAYLSSYNLTYLEQLDRMFKIWSDGYDTQSFFDLMQAEYGYKCEDLFKYCDLGVKPRDCCKELFRPIWVVRQGLCYQTRRNTNQTETDGIGQFVLNFWAPPSITSIAPNKTQSALIVYINNNFGHVIPSPYFDIFPNEWNDMHLTAKLIELVENPHDCTNKIFGNDASCFLKGWLTAHVVDPLNCTVPYLKNIPGIPEDTKICDPVTIARVYSSTVNQDKSLINKRCVPGCTKWEYGVSLVTRVARKKYDYAFGMAIFFGDLRYEHIKEISTISLSGLISQIGGQFGLFLGLSIITMFQMLIYAVNMVIHLFSRLLRPLPIGPKVAGTENTTDRVENIELHSERITSPYI